MNRQFRIVPTIHIFENSKDFCESFFVGKGDLILTNPSYYEPYFEGHTKGAIVVYAKNYGKGEPTDEMVDRIYADVKKLSYQRVIAIGGGSIIDMSKILALKQISPVADLYDRKLEIKKDKELVIVPTTCGTGSEVTSVAVLEVLSKGTKMGLQTEEEFADYAVLIPELLEKLPFPYFAASSIDALIHASESFLSPKATVFSELYSQKAIELILNGYQEIAKNGEEARKAMVQQFLIASTYAGIAFGNAGCAAVHAMSMPFSGAHHVAHGEANYAVFTAVFRAYQSMNPNGKITRFNRMLANALNCKDEAVYDKLDALLNIILKKKHLREYGVTEDELTGLVDTVVTKQGRLTANNYVPLSEKDMLLIYESQL